MQSEALLYHYSLLIGSTLAHIAVTVLQVRVENMYSMWSEWSGTIALVRFSDRYDSDCLPLPTSVTSTGILMQLLTCISLCVGRPYYI